MRGDKVLRMSSFIFVFCKCCQIYQSVLYVPLFVLGSACQGKGKGKGKGKGQGQVTGLQSCSRLSLLIQLYPLTGPVHSCTISTPFGALLHYHNRHWLNNHDANHVHMPGTHFATGWIGDIVLPVPKARLKLETLRLPIL